MRTWTVALLAALLLAPLPAYPQEKDGIERFFGEQHDIVTTTVVIYQELLRRLEKNEPFPPEALWDTAAISRDFMQEFHEKMEEKHLFSRFGTSGEYADMVRVLTMQHRGGGAVLDEILAQKGREDLDKEKLQRDILAFLQIYGPHKEREDTVLLPAARSVVTPEEYREIAQALWKEKQARYGEKGYTEIAGRLKEIERSLGVNE